MPAPLTQRVPPAFVRELCRRLKRSQELDVLIAMLWDRYDYRKAELDRMAERQDFTDPKVLSEVRKRQGALAEIANLAHAYEEWGRPENTEPARPDTLGLRPATTRLRKRAGARF